MAGQLQYYNFLKVVLVLLVITQNYLNICLAIICTLIKLKQYDGHFTILSVTYFCLSINYVERTPVF